MFLDYRPGPLPSVLYLSLSAFGHGAPCCLVLLSGFELLFSSSFDFSGSGVTRFTDFGDSGLLGLAAGGDGFFYGRVSGLLGLVGRDDWYQTLALVVGVVEKLGKYLAERDAL